LRFTVHRPADAEVSPCCHRPSGGDVACGVNVRIARARAAGDALENRLALAVFRRDMPTPGAPLRRVRSRDEFEPPDGFVLQSGNQQAPPLALNLSVEATLLRDVGAGAFTRAARRAGHASDIQLLGTDGREAPRHIGGGLFHPVTAAICFAGAQSGNGQLRSYPTARSPSRSCQPLLQLPQSLCFASTKARGLQKFPSGQRSRHGHAAINTNNAAVIGTWNRFRDGGKGDVPAPRSIQSDSIGLYGLGDLAGPPKPNPTQLWHPYLPIAAAQPPEVARFESDLPKSFVPTGLTPRRATVGAVEEVAHRLGEVPQRLLLYCMRPGGQPLAFGARRCQLGTLLVVTGCLASWLPVLLLLNGKIPHKPGMATMLRQYWHLLDTRKQPKPAHTRTLGAATDKTPKGGTRQFPPPGYSQEFSPPRIR
jgi:hypothetical protein